MSNMERYFKKEPINNSHHFHEESGASVFLSTNVGVNTAYHNDNNTVKLFAKSNGENVVSDYFRFKEQRIIKKPQSSISANVVNADRPKMSYTQLIVLALESSPKKALTVNEIYNWIEKNYPFYEGTGNGWKNSLRHNLSINKCFKKVIKTGQMGRGSYWIIEPNRRGELMESLFKHHFLPQHHISQSTLMLPSPQIVYIKDALPVAPVPNKAVVSNTSVVKPKHERLPRKSAIQTIGGKHGSGRDNSSLQMITHKFEWDLEVDGAPEILFEKPENEWTDTRLGTRKSELNPDLDTLSETSDTEYNDLSWCGSSRARIFPLKYHSVSIDDVVCSPVVSPDHTYCYSQSELCCSNLQRHVFYNRDYVPETEDEDAIINNNGIISESSNFRWFGLPERRDRLLASVRRPSVNLDENIGINLGTAAAAAVQPDVKKRGRPRKVPVSHRDMPALRRTKSKRQKIGSNKENGRYANDPIPMPSMPPATDISDESSTNNQGCTNQIEDDDALSQPIARSSGAAAQTDKLENMYNFSAFVDSL